LGGEKEKKDSKTFAKAARSLKKERGIGGRMVEGRRHLSCEPDPRRGEARLLERGLSE